MAQRHSEILDAGGRVVGISVDTPPQQSAMVDKLRLPFPLLSDPDRSLAIEPYGLADPKDPRNIARPATVIVDTAGEETFRTEGRDFADRPFDDEIIEAVSALGLPPTAQESPQLGPAEPSATAFRFDQLVPYYRGARFAAVAMGGRFPEARTDSDNYVAQLDGYTEAIKALYKTKQGDG